MVRQDRKEDGVDLFEKMEGGGEGNMERTRILTKGRACNSIIPFSIQKKVLTNTFESYKGFLNVIGSLFD